MAVNLNDFAKRIALREGKKVSVSIAQVKEVLRCFGDDLAECNVEEALAILAKLVSGRGP